LLKGDKRVELLTEEITKKREFATIAAPSVIELIKGLFIGNLNINEENKVNELISSMTVLNLDRDSSVLAGRIEAGLINDGEIIDLEDIMIAAIAISNNEKLITRNTKHLGRIKGLEYESY
jgi:predicted nucleic acid-binding protein